MCPPPDQSGKLNERIQCCGCQLGICSGVHDGGLREGVCACANVKEDGDLTRRLFDQFTPLVQKVGGEPRWQRRIEAATDRPGTMVGLALGAGLAEAATMLPYLGTIALLVGSGLGAWASGGLLGGYVLVMVLPALLLVLRLAVRRRWDPALQRLRGWVARSSAGTLSWVVAILGVLLARDAVPHLAPLLDRLGG